MRTTYVACELLLLASTIAALPELPIVKKKHGAKPVHQRKKRQSTVGTNVYDILTYSTGGAYYANITVGTPEQQMVVIVDTGSSDLYFDASSAPACQTNGAYSCKGGTFNPQNSKTYNIVDPAPAFDTKFGDGSTASGPFATDTVCIGDVCINDVQFGVATQVKATTGYSVSLMGVGYSANEATKIQYPNMPEVLKDAGVINSRLYSVYLNSEGAMSGSILFGGIDTTKYSGDIQIVDILPDPQSQEGLIFEFITAVTALKAKVGGDTSTIFSGGSPGIGAYQQGDVSLPVLLDTGSSAWSVPPDVYSEILDAFPYVSSQGLVDCSHADSSDTLTVTFNDAIDITVPAQDFIVPVYNRTTNQGYQSQDGGQQCVFMISPSQGTEQMGFDTLGDAILRSMYVVFDLDNAQLGLAQANVNSTASPNIKVVQSGANGIQKAVSNVKAAASSSTSMFPVASAVNGSASFSASTASTTIGTATGLNAVPAGAHPSSSGGSSGGSGSTHKNAAPSVQIPLGWGGVAVWVQGVVVMAGLGLGAWVMA